MRATPTAAPTTLGQGVLCRTYCVEAPVRTWLQRLGNAGLGVKPTGFRFSIGEPSFWIKEIILGDVFVEGHISAIVHTCVPGAVAVKERLIYKLM